MGNKTYYIKTYGCQMNESDSERIAAVLEKRKYKPAKEIAKSDLIIINACSVRQTAIDRVLGLKSKLKKLRTLNPELKTILTGCILESDRKNFEEIFDSVLTLSQFCHGRDKIGTNYLINYFKIKPKYSSTKLAFVPIMTGCDNFCSYCIVPHTRGREYSRPTEEIIKEIKNLIKKNYKEIILLGQNVNSYQEKTKNTGFVELLKLINKIPGNFTIKFLTNHPKDFSDELINTIAGCKKIAKEIHLPVQSGNNEILEKMNRGYTIEQYKNLVKKIRKKIPNAKISTDVIVGFPGETKKQFQNTVSLFKEIKYDTAFINKYSPRPGTNAFKLKDNIPCNEKKKRWETLNDLINKKQKLIVVLGPTASGKSDLAVKIAKKFNGEIISADSRQIYEGMNVGTGKITKKEMQSIPHHILDIASPKKQFTVAQFKKKTLAAVDKIYKKNKNPIICGGTGFYIQAITEKIAMPQIKPDQKLRKKLEKKNTDQLFKQLKKIDPRRAKEIDSKNRRRLIRAIEIVLKSGKPVPTTTFQPNSSWDILYIGIKKPISELEKRINKRVNKMIKSGLEKEVRDLIKKYGWTTVLKNSIGYQEWLTEKPEKEIIESIKTHTRQFAKRQMTWFSTHPSKRNINWVNPQTKIGLKKTFKLCEKFLKE